MFFDQVLAFDHVKKEIRLMVTVDLTREKREGAYGRAVRRLNGLEKRLASALPTIRKRRTEGKLKLTPRTSKAAFLKSVEKTKDYIASGDVFQCVLSRHASTRTPKSTPSRSTAPYASSIPHPTCTSYASVSNPPRVQGSGLRAQQTSL